MIPMIFFIGLDSPLQTLEIAGGVELPSPASPSSSEASAPLTQSQRKEAEENLKGCVVASRNDEMNRQSSRLSQSPSRRTASAHNFFDASNHSKASARSQGSSLGSVAYQGPPPRKRDGSFIKSSIRCASQVDLSCSTFDCGPINNRNSPSPTISSPANVTVKRSVSFSCINIREHERIAGDNPCVTSGVPLSIGWGYHQHDAVDVDVYEKNRGPSPHNINMMMVPANVRKNILRDEFGVSIRDMNDSMRNVHITRRQRKHTSAIDQFEWWEEVLQSTKRKFNRLTKKTTTVKEEEKLWEHAHEKAMKQYIKELGGRDDFLAMEGMRENIKSEAVVEVGVGLPMEEIACTAFESSDEDEIDLSSTAHTVLKRASTT